MTKSERRKKVRTKALVRELHKIKSSPNTATKRGYQLISQAILAKHKGGKKSKTRKSKK